jgi:hypothetical protein
MTLEAQYNRFLKSNPDTTFSFNEWMKWHGNQIEQALIQMMQDDEELGLYEQIDQDNPVTKGSTALVRKETKELNPYIEPFLLRNGFKKQENSSYDNLKCIITVLDGYYQIDWNHIKYGEISTYTDSYSITHLVGILTWNGLIDRNYKK